MGRTAAAEEMRSSGHFLDSPPLIKGGRGRELRSCKSIAPPNYRKLDRSEASIRYIFRCGFKESMLIN